MSANRPTALVLKHPHQALEVEKNATNTLERCKSGVSEKLQQTAAKVSVPSMTALYMHYACDVRDQEGIGWPHVHRVVARNVILSRSDVF